MNWRAKREPVVYPSDTSLAWIFPSECHFHTNCVGEMIVYADLCAFDRRWPHTLVYMSKTYEYVEGRWVAPGLKSKYGKAALYKEITSENAKT